MNQVLDATDTAAQDPTDLLPEIVAGLQGLGHPVEWDEVARTFRIGGPETGAVDGVALSSQRSVVLYRTWDDVVPADGAAQIAELTIRLNPQLFVTSLEFGESSGLLAVRAAVGLAGVEVTRGVLVALVLSALRTVVAAHRVLDVPVRAVLSGTSADEAATTFAHDLLAAPGEAGVAAL